MVLTPRFVILIAFAAFMIGFSGRLGVLLPAGVGLIALSVVLALADWLQLSRARVEVTRACEDKLSLGVHNAVRLLVRNRGYSFLEGILRDEYPEGFSAMGNVAPLHVAPRSESKLVYHVAPHKRGDYTFGDVYLRLIGPTGFAMRQIRFEMNRPVSVYPNLLDMRRYDVSLKRSRALEAGQRAVRLRGRGTDFESLREYSPDDEFRVVDWKASARRGKLISRQYQEEKSQNVLIALDCGRVMGPVIAGLTRLDHGINAAMMLAHVAASRGDKVGLVAFGEDIISYSPPRHGRSQTLSLLRLAYNLSDAAGDSNYYRAVPYISRRWTRRSLVVFFTDVVDPESSKPLISQVASLTKKHLCLCVAMSDPAVLDAARADRLDEPADAFAAAAARQVLRDRKAAVAGLNRAGAMVLDVLPGDFTPSVVDAYLDVKTRALL